MFILVVLGTTTFNVLADDFRVKAGVDMATYTSPGSGSPSIKINYKSLNLSFTYVDSDSGYFVDITNRSTLGNTTWNAGEFFANTASPNVPDAAAKRTENTITIGKVFPGGIQVFGGYQSNETDINTDLSSYGGSVYLSTVKMQGEFVGIGKSAHIGTGVLSGSAALALLGANQSTTIPNGTVSSYAAGFGYSLGVTYAYPLSNTFSWVADARLQSYNPNGYGSDSNTAFGLSLVAKF
jgi:hypothetical protein